VGIGLTLCQRIVDSIGGNIGFDSKEGEGSLFWFSLPLQEITKSTSRTLTVTPDAKKGLRILVVDDDEINRIVTGNLVKEMGFDVDFAENGEEALFAFLTTRYATILMDCQMPVMDGSTATCEIRKRERENTKRIPIIALTAHIAPEARQKCLAIGMDDFLSKPTKREVLRETLDKWIFSEFNARKSCAA